MTADLQILVFFWYQAQISSFPLFLVFILGVCMSVTFGTVHLQRRDDSFFQVLSSECYYNVLVHGHNLQGCT